MVKELQIFRSKLPEGPQRGHGRGNNLPRLGREKTTNISILNMVGEQFPLLQMQKNYEYFDYSFQKVPIVVRNNFPHFKLKNYEYFDRSFRKVLNMVGNNFPHFECKKNYEYFDPQRGQEQFPPLQTPKKNYEYFDYSFRKVLNLVMVGGIIYSA